MKIVAQTIAVIIFRMKTDEENLLERKDEEELDLENEDYWSFDSDSLSDDEEESGESDDDSDESADNSDENEDESSEET